MKFLRNIIFFSLTLVNFTYSDHWELRIMPHHDPYNIRESINSVDEPKSDIKPRLRVSYTQNRLMHQHRLIMLQAIANLRKLELERIANLESSATEEHPKSREYKFDDGVELYREYERYNLKTDDSSLIPENDINFGNLNSFHKVPLSTISLYDNRDYYFGNINKYSDKDIFQTFINFSLYSIKSYREGLKKFACYEKFILSFDKQLQTNNKFKEKLLTQIVNGNDVLDFIQNEAQRIRLDNIALENTLKKETIISNNLIDLKNKFEQEINYSDKPEILKQRLDAIEQTLKYPELSTKQYSLNDTTEKLLFNLHLNEDLFKTKTGTTADHQLHQEFVTTLLKASELHESTNSQDIKLGVQGTIEFLKKGAELNDKQKSAAYCFADAATDLLSFYQGVQQAFSDNVTQIKEFFNDPIDSTVTKFKNLYTLAHKAIISTSKAIIFAVNNSPDDENLLCNPELEVEKFRNIEAKGEEIRDSLNHLTQILNDMPRDQRFKTAGYIISDFALNRARGNISSNLLSLTKSNIKTLIDGSKLKKLGNVGQEVASIIGLGAQKGLSSTDTLLDYLKDQPKLPKKGIFKFNDSSFVKEKKLINKLNKAKNYSPVSGATIASKLTPERLKFLNDNFKTNYPIKDLTEFVKNVPGANLASGVLDKITNEKIKHLSTISGALYEVEKAYELEKKGEKIIDMGIKMPYFDKITKKVFSTHEVDIHTATKIIECKNINWKYKTNVANEIKKLRDQLGPLQKVALSHGKSLELHSRYALPKEFDELRKWLNKNNIKLVEDNF